jgi:hypothetical protein
LNAVAESLSPSSDADADDDDAADADSAVKQYSPHAIPRTLQSVGHVVFVVK